MNKIDVAIALLNDAKKQVNKLHYSEVKFHTYQDDLKLARRMILDMYTVNDNGTDYEAQKRVYKELSGHETNL